MAETIENKDEVKKSLIESIAKKIGIGKQEIIIREGQASKVYDPEPYKVKGTIDAPARWVESKMDYKLEGEDVDEEDEYELYVTKRTQNECVVEVNRDNKHIALITKHDYHFKNVIEGSLEESKEFAEFGINSGKTYNSVELAKFIKMHRSCFESKAIANELVNKLMSMKSSINRELERTENNRGDRRLIVEQTVKTNIPSTFTLDIPVFKGQAKKVLEIEIYIDPDDLSCQLLSPEAKDIIDTESNAIIDGVVERIKVAAPYITIIEI